jgi:hypothetical protein
MLAELTGVRDDFDAPRKFLKAALLARYANVGEGDPTDGENIDAALNIWVRRNTDRLGLRQSDDYFHFVEDLIRLAGHHRTFLEASRHLYDKSGLEALYYNEVNGLTNQMALILAAVQPRDILSQAKEKAALVANFLDRLYVEGTLNDEPVQAKDFEPDIHRLIPQLRKCSTPQDVSALLSAALPTTAFEPVATFGMRGNNKAQVRYLLARLTAYVETGCHKPNLIADYLAEERTWQIEHLYANHPQRHLDEIPDRDPSPSAPCEPGSVSWSCSAGPTTPATTTCPWKQNDAATPVKTCWRPSSPPTTARTIRPSRCHAWSRSAANSTAACAPRSGPQPPSASPFPRSTQTTPQPPQRTRTTPRPRHAPGRCAPTWYG